MLERVPKIVDECLAKSGLTLRDIDAVELIGSGWRMPKVQGVLKQLFADAEPSRGGKEALYLGQHLNGDEAMVMGASAIAANHSNVIRPRQKVFFSDSPAYTYEIDVMDPQGEQMKNSTVIAGPGQRYGLMKKISVKDATTDFEVRLYEEKNQLTTWKVTGVEKALASDEHKERVERGVKPKISFEIGPDNKSGTGLIVFRREEAVFTEMVEVDVVATQVEAVGRCHHKRKRTSSMCNISSTTSISNRCKARILPDCLTYRTGVVQASPVEILRRASGSFLIRQYFFRLCGPTHL